MTSGLLTKLLFYGFLLYASLRLLRSSKVPVRELFVGRISKKDWIWILPLGGLVFAFQICAGLVWTDQFVRLIPDLYLNMFLRPQPYSLMSSAVDTLLAPPLEELFSRGGLLLFLANKVGMKWAAIISSFLFALLHIEFVGHFVGALIFVCLYLKTSSLLAPIVVHYLFDGWVFISKAMDPAKELSPVTLADIHSAAMEVRLPLIPLSIAVIYCLYRFWPLLNDWKSPRVRAFDFQKAGDSSLPRF